MQVPGHFLKAIPMLASLDIERSVDFLVDNLGFRKVHAEPGVYGIAERDHCAIHYWACPDKMIAENTGCRIVLTDIDALYRHAAECGIVHPNGHLSARRWGSLEFTIQDPDGNCITFAQFPGEV
jgi:catechol 2,3-dioxygenase-like lactoylglutathione lyase family enzyme